MRIWIWIWIFAIPFHLTFHNFPIIAWINLVCFFLSCGCLYTNGQTFALNYHTFLLNLSHLIFSVNIEAGFCVHFLGCFRLIIRIQLSFIAHRTIRVERLEKNKKRGACHISDGHNFDRKSHTKLVSKLWLKTHRNYDTSDLVIFRCISI